MEKKSAEISFNAAHDNSSSLKDFSTDQILAGTPQTEVTFNSTVVYNRELVHVEERNYHTQPPPPEDQLKKQQEMKASVSSSKGFVDITVQDSK